MLPNFTHAEWAGIALGAFLFGLLLLYWAYVIYTNDDDDDDGPE